MKFISKGDIRRTTKLADKNLLCVMQKSPEIARFCRPR